MPSLWALVALLMTSHALAQPTQPEAAEEPAPPEPLGATMLPPLSLGDAQWLTARSQQILERRDEEVTPEDMRLARLMLQCVIDHVQLVDQRRSSLTEDTWVYIGKDRLTEPDTPQQFTITLEGALENVQEVALDCTREMVEIQVIRVDGTEGDPILRQPSRTLDPRNPGRSFFHLPHLVAVTAVTVTAEALTWEEGRPRVKVWLGQTPRPEYLRQAVRHLLAARTALDEQDRDRAAARLDLAYRDIGRAEEDETP